jgi:hypothetical protein
LTDQAKKTRDSYRFVTGILPIPILYDSTHRTPRAAVETTAAATQIHVPMRARVSFFPYMAAI